jgi:hypothetical protein
LLRAPECGWQRVRHRRSIRAIQSLRGVGHDLRYRLDVASLVLIIAALVKAAGRN